MRSLVIEGLGPSASALQAEFLQVVDRNMAGSGELPKFELEKLAGMQFGPMVFDHFTGAADPRVLTDAAFVDGILEVYQGAYLRVYEELDEIWRRPEGSAAKVQRAVYQKSTDDIFWEVGKLRSGILDLLNVRRLLEMHYAKVFLAASIAATD